MSPAFTVGIRVRASVTDRTGHGPNVPREAYFPVGASLVLVLLVVILNDHYSRVPYPESLAGRIFVAVFGSGRFFLTWPLVPLVVVGAYSLFRRLVRTRNRTR